MNRFIIKLTQSAVADLDHLPETRRTKIISSIENLCSHPFASRANTKKLMGFKPPLYRLRSGDSRVLYRIQENIIFIMRVIDRKDLEKIIKRLKLSKA